MHSTPQTIEIDRRDETFADRPYLAMCNCCSWKSLRRFSLGTAQTDAKRHREQNLKCRKLPKGSNK